MNTPRLQSLLAWLILQANTPQPRERLASLLWPESSGPQARTNLRQLLHHLKHALPSECNFLRVDHLTIYWHRDEACSVDTILFERAVAEATQARTRGDAASETEALQAAVRLYADDLLPTVYDAWLVPFRQNLHGQLSTALYRLAVLLEQQGEVQAAIAWAERLITHDAPREINYQLLFRLHLANGDRASALRTYHQLKTVLRREFGVTPGPGTVEMFERVLKGDHARLSSGTRPASERKDARPLVGRTLEKQRLGQAWTGVASGRSHAVIVSGEPGIGKTRLAEDLLQDVAQQGFAIARARCYSGRGQAAYAPIADWLRSDPLRAVWAELLPAQRGEIARLIPEIREIAPDLEELPGSAESWQKVLLYEALRAAYAKAAHPLLLFLDDLQWCDADSLEWLRLLLISSPANGVLLLGTVRAEETGRDHPFAHLMAELRQAGLVSEVHLSPLTANETMQLASQESAEALPGQRLEAIVRATRGNPLFVLESVRSGMESTRVHAVISARLAYLSAPSYELAGLASVVGRPFSFELLEKASDWDERSLSHALDELWQRRIIEGSGGAEYDFTHDRLREVVRGELTPVRLRYLHRRVARALAESYRHESQEWNGQIAWHYEQAGMVEQAIEHLRSAAESARQRFAYTEAAALLHRGIELRRQSAVSSAASHQELDLLLLLGTVLVTTEGYSAPEVGTTYRRALELARPAGGTRLFSSLSGLWVFHVVRGEVETSRRYALEFLDGAGDQAWPGLKLAGNFLLGSSLCHLGQFEPSRFHLSLALERPPTSCASVLEVFGGPDVRVFCRAYLAHVAWHRAPRGDDTSADTYINEAIQTADQMGHPFIQAIALTYATMLYALRDDSGSALQSGRRAVRVCTDNSFAYYLAMANVLTAWAVAAEGDVPAGLDQFREGFESMRRLGAELRLPYFYALLAESYSRAGLSRDASASLSTGFAFAGKNGEAWGCFELHRVQGNLLAAEGNIREAGSSYQKALQIAQYCGSLAFERRIRRLLDVTQSLPGSLTLERS